MKRIARFIALEWAPVVLLTAGAAHSVVAPRWLYFVNAYGAGALFGLAAVRTVRAIVEAR